MSEGNLIDELRIYLGYLSNSTLQNIYDNYFITLNNNEITRLSGDTTDFLEYLFHLVNTNNNLVGFTLLFRPDESSIIK